MTVKRLACFLSVLVLAAPFASLAASLPLSDTGNKHNLSSGATHGGPQAALPADGGTTEVCIFCHTPHHSSPQSTLWNRQGPATASFPLYGGSSIVIDDPGTTGKSLYKNDGSVEYPNGATRLCLSCHDGATAVGEVLNGGTFTMAGPALTSIVDLSASHPVSFVYDDAVWGDIQLLKPGAYKQPSVGFTYVPLDGEDRMQCTTCHDPHTDTATEVHGLPFWRHNINDAVLAYDQVCNDCHLLPYSVTSGHGVNP